MERRQLQRGRIAAGIVAAHRPPLGDDRPEDPETASPVLIHCGASDSAGDETLHRLVARSTMPSVTYVAPNRSRAATQTLCSSRSESRSDASSRPILISARSRALAALQVAGLLRELVGEQPQVLAIELQS